MSRTGIASALVCAAWVMFAGAATPARAQRLARENRRDVGLLKRVNGPVCIKPGGKDPCYPATRGTTLRRDDTLIVETKGEARVRCYCLPPGEEPDTKPKYEGRPCPSDCPRTLGLSRVMPLNTAGEAAGITTAQTAVFASTPALSWAEVESKSSYRVSVSGPSFNHIADGVTSNFYSIPANRRLKSNATYAVTVADSRNPERAYPVLNFKVLSEGEAAAVRAIEEEIRELGLAPEQTRLLTARLYASWGLNLDALRLLESLFENEAALSFDLGDVFLLMGDLYLETGKNSEAQKAYTKALITADLANDKSLKAYALEGVGLSYSAAGKTGKTVNALQSARRLFEELGNVQKAEELNAYLSR